MKRDKAIIDTSGDADQFMKEIEGLILDRSPEEKVRILSTKLRYWYWSAIDWRNMYNMRHEG